MKKKKSVAVLLLPLLSGVGFLLYPDVSSMINDYKQSRAVLHYIETVDTLDTAALQRERELAMRYNEAVSRLESLADYDPAQISINYWETLDVDAIMGTLSIPCIDVYLPIRHGIDEAMLMQGVGHRMETALPIGGEGNHSVLTGHHALASATLFSDLYKVELGDVFYINVLDETLCYQVDQIAIIDPDDVSGLLPVPDKDYCTLVTCTPYSINSHRLIVRGERCAYVPSEEVEVKELPTDEEVHWRRRVLLGFAVFWALLFIGYWRSGRQFKPEGGGPMR